MNQMLFPAQLGAPQTPGQSTDTDTLGASETGEGALFGLMMGFVQQPELAAEWRQQLASLGNSLPPEQAEALNGWLQQLSSGQLSPGQLAGFDLDSMPAGLGQLIQERFPQLAAQLNQALAGGDAAFKQALAQLRSGAEAGSAGLNLADGELANKGGLAEGTLRPISEDPSRLWTLNPVAKLLQAGAGKEAGVLDTELLEGGDLTDSAKPLRGLASVGLTEAKGADPLTRTVATPIHEPSWGRNFAEQILMVQQAGASRARLILDPPSLGPVEVDMKMQGEQTSIVFHSPHQSVRDSIENNLPRLREMMAEQGVDLLDVNVSGEQQREQAEQREQFFAQGGSSGGDSDGLSGEDSASTQTTLTVADLGLVDYYA